MFLDNTNHQPEPVAVARIYPQDLKLNKLHSANLPKLPSIAQPFHLLPNNATPRQKNLRQEILYPAQDKPTFHVEDAASSRGPKVLSKNLPDVFLSNLSNKAGKISGLRSRNRDPDRDSSTFVMSRDQICNTEPDAEIKHDDSPIQMKYGKITYRPKDRSPKKLYGKQAHLNLLINPADMPERLSTDESPTNQTLSSFNEIPIARLKSIEDTLRSDRDQIFKGDTLPTITDRISPGLNGGLNSMNFSNAAAAKLENNSNLIRIEQKINYAQNPVHPRQGKQMSDMSLDMIRKPAAVNFKKNIVMEARDNASHSFHDVIKPIQMRDNVLLKANTKEIKDNKSYNASVSPRNVDFANNAQMNVIDPASAGAKLSLPDTQRQNKKTFIFKKIVGKSNKSDALELSNRKISVRGKEKVYRQQTMPSIQLSELITLKKINETLGNSKMKRMLHAPSLKLFDLHVESITELNPKESMYIKEKLNEWKNSFISSRYLQRVYSCYWNSPEGCVSILLEPSKSGFLNGVISQYNSLPERCIQTLARDVLQGLNEVHAITRKAHGNVALNEVIIGSQGHFKLSPGISQMFTNFLNTNKSSPFIDDGFLAVVQKSPKSGSLVKETLSQDIFDYGYLLLQSAIGDLSLYDPSHILTLDNIKKALESEKSTKHSSTVCCCLLHSEDIVRKIIERSAKKPKHMLVKHRSAPDNCSQTNFKAIGKIDPEISSPSMYIPLLEVLTAGNRFSKAFIDFLCSCLKLDDFLRANSQSLSGHPFLDEDHISNGSDISMKEILKIMKKKDNSKTIQENLESHLERFTESLGVAFLNKEVQEKFERVIKEESARKVEDKKIVDLANELDVSPKKLWDHINLCVSKLETDP